MTQDASNERRNYAARVTSRLALLFAVIIAAGTATVWAADTPGGVAAWGFNDFGQTIVPAAARSGVIRIAAGYAHSLALKDTGEVIAWGCTTCPQALVPAEALSGVIAIAAGHDHSVALTSSGKVVTWGAGPPVPAAALSGVKAIAAGIGEGGHTVALKNDGTVLAWGGTGQGEANVPPGLTDVIAIAAGGGFDLALKSDGSVVSWGNSTVVPLEAQSGVSAIAAGGSHSLILKNGGVFGWGSDIWGQISFMPPTGQSGIIAIAAGVTHSLALRSDGTVIAWGRDDSRVVTGIPAGLSHVTAITAGSYHNLAIATITYNLTYAAGTGGTLDGIVSQSVLQGGSGTSITAVPNTGYHFVKWSDDSTQNPRTDTNVMANVSVTAIFSINLYTLTYTAGTGGTLTGTTSQTVAHGGSGTQVTAVPDTGHYFSNWSDGLTTNARTDTNVTGSLSVMANFAPNIYTLTYAAGAGGTVTGSPSQTVPYGGSGTQVTATANTGYHFVDWSDGSAANPRTDGNVTANVSVTANFAVNTYTLTYAASAGGTLTGITSQTVAYGQNGTAVTAVANAGSHFVNWSDGSSVNPRIETNVTANLSVTANFAANTYTLTYTAGANGTLSGTTSQTVAYGQSGTAVMAVPNGGYHFVNWSDGSTVNPRTDTNVTANLSVTANFAANTYTLTYTAGANGTLSGTTSQTVAYGQSGTAVTAVADTGNRFVNWSDGSTTNPRTDTNVTANVSVTANFAANTYTLTYAAGTGGTLTGTTSQTVAYGQNGTAVTAVANTGNHFVNWSDGSTATSRTDTNVTANISVTANFAANTYTLTYTAGANGTLSGTTSQTVAYGQNGTAVTAVANTGYHFVNWNDGSTANPRTDASVTANLSVIANFAANTYTLTYTAGTGGTLSGTTSQTVAYGQNGTAITAVASTGYHFLNWSDGSTANPRTDLNVTGNVSVTANFAVNTYTLTYAAGTGGTLSGSASQTVAYGQNGTAITAIANTGYHFVSWNDGSTANPRTDTNVMANLSVTANFALNAVNTVPTITSITGPAPTAMGTAGTVTATFSDPDPDTHVCNISWDDATASAGTVNEAAQSCSGSHTYSVPGVYVVTVTVTDNHGGISNAAQLQYFVVYDPSSGFVTGRGWINSPAGAYAPNPALTGRANFGFVSKYAKGKTTPTGETQFQFQVANFNFQSSLYDWLVVSGARAQFKGSGTVNGAGNYSFLLSAIDGSLGGGGGSDKFRIKIWDKATGVVTYDNQLGADENADPTTVIASGSILIHN